MPTVSDINDTVFSGLNHIDALLDVGPDWNYLTPAGNTILFTFSVATGMETVLTGQAAFTATQQANTRAAMAYIMKLTGIQFVETTDGDAAQIHLCNLDIADASTTGLCRWNSTMQQIAGTTTIVGYDSNAYIYLDNKEWGARNATLNPGSFGYETLLHELGHALGLKHPFEGDVTLPASTDNTSNTLMSYNDVGSPHTSFIQYDVAALNWIYGGDGLGGALGINSITGARYFTGTNSADVLTGTSFNDTLEGDGGNDMINGGDGIDTVVFRGTRDAYTFTQLGDGTLLATSLSGADGSDTLKSVEILQFSNGSYQSAQVLDTTAPAAPTMSVTKNAAGYVVGDTAFVVGIAEADSTVKVYTANGQVGSAQADGRGFWSLATSAFPDGLNYQIFAKATDKAGNTSASSASLSFNVDAHAPVAPTASVSATAGSNQPVFNGTGEAGSTILLVNGNTPVGQTTVGANGAWNINANPLPNGSYDVTVISTDKADNATNAASHLTFTVASTTNLIGTAGNDRISPTAGNNAVDGMGGIDTAVYAGARADFTVTKDVNGFTVTDNVGANGKDSLINIERIQFGDASMALDVNGTAGEAYRLYQAAFNRAPDLPGLGFWIKQMDEGLSVSGTAACFISSPEFIDMYQGTDDRAFISKLYNNVLHRAGEDAGMNFWLNALEADHNARAKVLAFFSESPENQAQVIGSIQNGFIFVPYA